MSKGHTLTGIQFDRLKDRDEAGSQAESSAQIHQFSHPLTLSGISVWRPPLTKWGLILFLTMPSVIGITLLFQKYSNYEEFSFSVCIILYNKNHVILLQ